MKSQVLIISFSKDKKEPLFFIFKNELNEQNLSKFVSDFKNNKIHYDVISEDL